jgi:hypothetical protein
MPCTTDTVPYQNANKIDDEIDNVHLNGWNAAFVDNDPTKRMRIGVTAPRVAPGIYYLHFRAGSFTQNVKVSVIR